jgi:hypothetical protein
MLSPKEGCVPSMPVKYIEAVRNSLRAGYVLPCGLSGHIEQRDTDSSPDNVCHRRIRSPEFIAIQREMEFSTSVYSGKSKNVVFNFPSNFK